MEDICIKLSLTDTVFTHSTAGEYKGGGFLALHFASKWFALALYKSIKHCGLSGLLRILLPESETTKKSLDKRENLVTADPY